MARNGSGTYTAPANSVNPAVAATTIDASDFNDVLDDVETALTESIARDGQTTTTAVIPFASGVKTDTIVERSANTGVTVDGVLLKDSNVTVSDSVIFEGATADAFETTLTVTDPTADRTATIPDLSGTFMFNLVEDTTPQLGGPLDANSQPVRFSKGGDIASASPLVLGTDGNYFDVTGTTGFSAITVAAGSWFMLQFDGALTMTDGASLDLAGANITTAAGDRAIFFATAANTVQMMAFHREGVEPLAYATQAQQEAGTAANVAVSSGRQHFHPSAAKGWVRFQVNGTIDASYNVTSITDTGTGDWTVNWGTDFSTANYCVTTDWLGTISSLRVLTRAVGSVAAGTTQIEVVRSSDGVAVETGVTAIYCAAHGDFA